MQHHPCGRVREIFTLHATSSGGTGSGVLRLMKSKTPASIFSPKPRTTLQQLWTPTTAIVRLTESDETHKVLKKKFSVTKKNILDMNHMLSFKEHPSEGEVLSRSTFEIFMQGVAKHTQAYMEDIAAAQARLKTRE